MTISFRNSLPIALIAIASFLLAGVTWSLDQAGGRDFFVDTAGNDANDGASPKSAWRSLAKINSTALLPDDTIHLKRGCIWRETLEPSRGGLPGRPVSFLSYGKGDA